MTLRSPLVPLVAPSAAPRPPRGIDPDAPAGGEGLFGLGLGMEESRFVAIPVPYEATVSSGQGTLDGPGALLEASDQVDFADPWAGEPWREGLTMLDEAVGLRARSSEAGRLVERLRGARERGDEGADPALREECESLVAGIDAIGEEIAGWLDASVSELFAAGRVPLVVGGEHAVAQGAHRAAARRHPGLGILQIDAHADLRAAMEGLRSSHACVMARALELEGVARLVQVGLRDISGEEREAARAAGERVVWWDDRRLAEDQLAGRPFAATVEEILAALPELVWISFDVDGLDPSHCPGTGTPVPGGLTYREAAFLIDRLARSGRRVVGADLVEVGAGSYDGFVAAKLLYLLAGAAASGPSTT